MTYKFLPQLPNTFSGKPVLISGQESINLGRQEYLTVDDNEDEYFLEIRYDVHCSPFKEACLVDKILGVGHEEHFYLFDLETKTHIVSIKVEGYFGHVYLDDKLFYVAGASELYCLDKRGKIIWRNSNLGIDGVIVETFQDNVILGTGEWDPPNGWRNFRLDKSTGDLIK